MPASEKVFCWGEEEGGGKTTVILFRHDRPKPFLEVLYEEWLEPWGSQLSPPVNVNIDRFFEFNMIVALHFVSCDDGRCHNRPWPEESHPTEKFDAHDWSHQAHMVFLEYFTSTVSCEKGKYWLFIFLEVPLDTDLFVRSLRAKIRMSTPER